MKIKALILTAAVIASAAVGAAAYAALGSAIRPQEDLSVRPDAAAAEGGSAQAQGSGTSVPGRRASPVIIPDVEWETESGDPGVVTEPESSGQLPAGTEPPDDARTAEAAARPLLPEQEGCMLTLRGRTLYVTTLASFGGDVVFSRPLPEGKQLADADAAPLACGIIFARQEDAVAAVWDLLT